MPNVKSDVSSAGVATLTIDREEKRNALDRATLRELEAAFDAAAANTAVRAIVLRGAGDKVFCAGADLKEVLGHASMDESRAHFDGVVRVMRAMERAPQPVIARVPGFALAGGFGLAVAADLTIAAESAQFGLPEISLGLLPLMVSVPILRAVGSRKVLLDLVLTGRRVGAREAQALGITTRVVPDSELDATVAKLCDTFASYSPSTLRMGKEAVYTMAEMEAHAALTYLREAIILTSRTEDAQEGIAAFFEQAEPEMDRALEAEAKAVLRAARARLEELAEEEFAWTPKPGAEAHAEPARKAERGEARAPAPVAREVIASAAPPTPSAPALPLGEARTLEQVRAHLGECTRCPLHQGRTRIVFGDGNAAAELMFVGEGPGEQEDLSGLPFVGRAGELLTQMIEAGLKIPRASVYIANAVKCRPPNNRTPLPTEVAACREFLDGQIDAIRPKVIVALGKPATSLLLGRDVSITRVRGTWHDYRGFPVMPTFHPAFLLRQYTPENRRLVWEDLKAALEKSKT